MEILNQTVKEELESLPADMRAKLDHIVRLIEEFGLNQVHEPYVKRIRDKLWEMRLTGRDGIARALYVTAKGRRIVVLHAFHKKSPKLPKRAVETALSRMKEVNR